jgi:hypothetical protein
MDFFDEGMKEVLVRTNTIPSPLTKFTKFVSHEHYYLIIECMTGVVSEGEREIARRNW